jgi:hypothetical protein
MTIRDLYDRKDDRIRFDSSASRSPGFESDARHCSASKLGRSAGTAGRITTSDI